MTMYVIENEDGCVLDQTYYEFTNDVHRALLFDEPIAPAEYAKRYGGRVVPLAELEPVEVSEDTVAKILREAKRYADDYISEDKLKFEIKTALSVYKPAPEVVSEAEAEMLEQATCYDDPAELIVGFVNSHDKYDDDSKAEDRLMRAYVIGWTVEKPKRWIVKVPHTDDSYFYKIDDEYCNAGDSYHLEGMTDKKWFTLAEIEHYGLTDCLRLEVTDDEQ